ncbi:hypothetical protein, partial [Brevibacterium aurantiacum]|uniref:hypothetical protein n=1 Tax=Brevibacterium aurantiacum TaxID=273384 RepID=UPI003F923A42
VVAFVVALVVAFVVALRMSGEATEKLLTTLSYGHVSAATYSVINVVAGLAQMRSDAAATSRRRESQ